MNPHIEVTARRVQVFKWEHPSGERHCWFVEAAIEMIRATNRKPNAKVWPKDVTYLIRNNPHAANLEQPFVDAADLSQPVIMVTHYDTEQGCDAHILIDGWHRVKKHWQTDSTQPLLAFVLTKTESEDIEIEWPE